MVLREVTDELRLLFDGARRVAVLTGAGISAESGVPTFRGGGGAEIWTWRGRPFTELSSAELITAQAERREPRAQLIKVGAGIDERAADHVAARTGEAIKIQRAHQPRSFKNCGRMSPALPSSV